MSTSTLLDGLKIIDLSHRLPGPLAGYYLSNLGAKVVKVEDQKFKDPFVHGLFKDMDGSFPTWYREFNQNKELLRIDFKSAKDVQKLKDLISNSDGVLMGIPNKLQEQLGLSRDFFEGLNKPFVVLRMDASKNKMKAMHDLNALAETGLLSLYCHSKTEEILAPPFLPFAGIAFAQRISKTFLAATYKALKSNSSLDETVYLLESTKESFSPLWPKELKDKGDYKFLHNGLYPCYCLYKTNDNNYVALAAVEEKFWSKFIEIFDLNLNMEDRFFHEDHRVFELISKKILAMDSEKIIAITKNDELCLSVITN